MTVTATFTEDVGVLFDFGTLTSPVETGYTQVTETTQYTTTLGYGWTTTTDLHSRDRGLPDDLRRDFVFSSNSRTFSVDLANGDYQITITIGDQIYNHNQIDVYAEDTLKIDNLNTQAGTFHEETFWTTITDGQLNIKIADNGGTDPYWIINSLTVEPGTPPTPISEASFDFGTSVSPVETDYTQVTETTQYTALQGYGWTTTTGLLSRDRTLPDDLKGDFIFSPTQNTFNAVSYTHLTLPTTPYV